MLENVDPNVASAAGFVAAYLAGKGKGLAQQVGHDVDSLFDQALSRCYGWVKQRLSSTHAGERALHFLGKDPEGEAEIELVAEELEATLLDDTTARGELARLVQELDSLRPPGLIIRGLATSESLEGHQAGAVVEATMAEGSVEGQSIVKGPVRETGQSVGVVFRPRP